MVNESYPSDCIRFLSVLSTTYSRFRVDGIPLITENTKPTVAVATEPSSAESLQVKPSRREYRSPETSQSSHEVVALKDPVVEKMNTTAKTHEIDNHVASHGHDILDDMIDEARVMMHLVIII